ncbi:hypothetical protein K523DRAFT_304348 [Schizophyllum commune Tattone D]|nr:hypothetical protein K523DRAFT_304348 [Schizophyllum commune Tattone D]
MRVRRHPLYYISTESSPTPTSTRVTVPHPYSSENGRRRRWNASHRACAHPPPRACRPWCRRLPGWRRPCRYCGSSYPGGYRQRRGRLDIRRRASRGGYWGDSCRWDGCGRCSWRRGHIHCLPILIQFLVGRPICCSYLLEALLCSASLFSNDLQMAASFP